MGSDPADTHSTPRWVKAFAIVGIVVVVVLLSALVIGATTGNLGEHSPMRHFGGDGGSTDHGSGNHTTPTNQTMSHTDGNHTRPSSHGGA